MSEQHISYAMRNEEATNALIYFNAPSALQDWTFLVIEWMLILGMVLTVLH